LGRRIRRYVFFVLAIVIGVAIGLLIGWVFPAAKDGNAGFDSLRIDYQTDTILMVSQLYQSDGDLTAALARLSLLGEDAPTGLMKTAINYATQHAYAPADIYAMQNLAEDIVQLLPTSD